MSLKKIAALVFCLNGYFLAIAQQDLGIRNSNYAGVQSVLLNPSAIADSKLKWDVNVVSIGTVFDNNFLFIPKGTTPFFGFGSILKGIKKQDKFFTNYDPSQPGKLYNFTLSEEIMGPSFHAEVAKNQQIGFTIVSRSYGNLSNFTGALAQNAFDYLKNQELWNVPLEDHGSKEDMMSWIEYGFEYATVLYKKDNRELTGGITLKLLQGIAGAYVKNTNLNYTIADTSNIHFTNTNLDYGRTDYDSYRKISSPQDLTHGHGFGFNLGFSYVQLKDATAIEAEPAHKKWYDPDKNNYVFKVGLSLIDVGSIKYNSRSSTYHLAADDASLDNLHSLDIKTNEQLDRTLSAAFYGGDSTKSYVTDHFKMALPAAISLQADWNFLPGFFANMIIVKGFGHSNDQGVVRPDVYSITPRYETKWFEASIPVSLIYYGIWRPRVGLAMRFGYFFFGGDALGGLAGLNNLQGVDFYAGFHFFITR